MTVEMYKAKEKSKDPVLLALRDTIGKGGGVCLRAVDAAGKDITGGSILRISAGGMLTLCAGISSKIDISKDTRGCIQLTDWTR